jgi:mono/diheme cytochrome c family protein
VTRHGSSACLALVALLIAVPAVRADAARGADRIPPPVRAQVDAGKEIFQSTCASGMCHGPGGMGGHGPSLKRVLAPDLIRETVQNGRPGTPMPAFKDLFDADAQAQLVAYVLWLSSDGKWPMGMVTVPASANGAVVAARRAAATPWLGSSVSSESIAVGSDKGNPRTGAALFFDATKLYSCRSCHNYSGAGGPVGPDLADLGKPAIDVYRSLSHADTASTAYPAILLTLRDGARMVGIKRDETSDALRIYDVSSVPPVSRRVRKSAVANVVSITGAGIYDHTALPYSKQELLDVSSFLGRAP